MGMVSNPHMTKPFRKATYVAMVHQSPKSQCPAPGSQLKASSVLRDGEPRENTLSLHTRNNDSTVKLTILPKSVNQCFTLGVPEVRELLKEFFAELGSHVNYILGFSGDASIVHVADTHFCAIHEELLDELDVRSMPYGVS
mmetsp:Transcript_27065/g.49219  ORF Transcript_27065/g.49219 Transcript_27065/m.49219 type:complete len:141 (-) Transcript_27065:57-479(-)